eukprot:CAMPEP_0203964178 /NCGR_PEP_ID=MMETSP0359-20131031/93984_1 /ASSEMBLY_ACC=CAM_ASM_000338 /TAXON_ID=268821 /ORGANISM="Scrippsiella Hangoei, Strain SHTV-5" /LENGTH=94 /DNA_ID=CAMNT_0050900457 /DNA_START=136 /DNA_END=420 /DNA_ORIENTATION=+
MASSGMGSGNAARAVSGAAATGLDAVARRERIAGDAFAKASCSTGAKAHRSATPAKRASTTAAKNGRRAAMALLARCAAWVVGAVVGTDGSLGR